MIRRAPVSMNCPDCGIRFNTKKGHACKPKLFRCSNCGLKYNFKLTHRCRKSATGKVDFNKKRK